MTAQRAREVIAMETTKTLLLNSADCHICRMTMGIVYAPLGLLLVAAAAIGL